MLKEEEKNEEVKSLGNLKDEPKKEKAEVVEESKEEEKTVSAEELRPTCYKKDETPQQMGDRLQKDADKKKEDLNKVKDKKKLDKMEKEILDNLQKMDDYLKVVTYALPKKVKYKNKTLSANMIAGRINDFIKRKEVQFSYTLGLLELYNFWHSVGITNGPTEISYGVYDSTLRILGDMVFKGPQDWENIIIINEYFRLINDEYIKDLTALQYYSQLHSQLLDRMKLLQPVAENHDDSHEQEMVPEEMLQK